MYYLHNLKIYKNLVMEHNNEKVLIKIVYEKTSRRIIGAQIASKQDISMGIHLFSLAIQEKVTIDINSNC